MKIEIECIDCKDSGVVEALIYALEQCKHISWRLDVVHEDATKKWYSNISMPSNLFILSFSILYSCSNKISIAIKYYSMTTRAYHFTMYYNNFFIISTNITPNLFHYIIPITVIADKISIHVKNTTATLETIIVILVASSAAAVPMIAVQIGQ